MKQSTINVLLASLYPNHGFVGDIVHSDITTHGYGVSFNAEFTLVGTDNIDLHKKVDVYVSNTELNFHDMKRIDVDEINMKKIVQSECEYQIHTWNHISPNKIIYDVGGIDVKTYIYVFETESFL